MLGSIGTAVMTLDVSAEQESSERMFESRIAEAHTQPFVLPSLPYAYDALEPHIDARTMEIHLARHHKAYVDNANKTLSLLPGLRKYSAEDLLLNLLEAPEPARAALRNNVGGHVNHSIFWKLLVPGGARAPSGRLADAIRSTFGSFDAFAKEFSTAASSRFGSGWAWLVVPRQGGLKILSTANQDSPLLENAVPIVGLDVWEHAYYIKYQNRRADYIQAFWKVLNWDVAAKHFAAAA